MKGLDVKDWKCRVVDKHEACLVQEAAFAAGVRWDDGSQKFRSPIYMVYMHDCLNDMSNIDVEMFEAIDAQLLHFEEVLDLCKEIVAVNEEVAHFKQQIWVIEYAVDKESNDFLPYSVFVGSEDQKEEYIEHLEETLPLEWDLIDIEIAQDIVYGEDDELMPPSELDKLCLGEL